MTKSESQTGTAIELFARCCEELNDFARSLRSHATYGEVTTHSDIRNYASGWRLEKYIEAENPGSDGQAVAWCIELGRDNGKWLVASSVSISHSDAHFDLGIRLASTEEELKRVLDESLVLLIGTVQPGSDLSTALERTRN